MNFQEFRERINVGLYHSKDRVLGVLKVLNLLVSASALFVLALYYGFTNESETAAQLLGFVKFSFGFYVLQYITRLLYDFQPRDFLRHTWFEAAVMVVLVIEGFSDLLTGELLISRFIQSIGFNSISDFYTIFIQGYFFTIVLAELLRGGRVLPAVAARRVAARRRRELVRSSHRQSRAAVPSSHRHVHVPCALAPLSRA